MANMYPPVRAAAFDLYFSLYKNDGTVIANPGTYTSKVSKDGGAVEDIATAITEVDTSYGLLKLSLTATEMTADVVWVKVKDDTTGCVPFTACIYTVGQTMDSIYSRLGAPEGASISADVAAVQTAAEAIVIPTDYAKPGDAMTVAGYAEGKSPAEQVLDTPSEPIHTNGGGNPIVWVNGYGPDSTRGSSFWCDYFPSNSDSEVLPFAVATEGLVGNILWAAQYGNIYTVKEVVAGESITLDKPIYAIDQGGPWVMLPAPPIMVAGYDLNQSPAEQVTGFAVPGDKMDLVDAPSAIALTAISEAIGVPDIDASAIADAVWDEAILDHAASELTTGGALQKTKAITNTALPNAQPGDVNGLPQMHDITALTSGAGVKVNGYATGKSPQEQVFTKTTMKLVTDNSGHALMASSSMTALDERLSSNHGEGSWTSEHGASDVEVNATTIGNDDSALGKVAPSARVSAYLGSAFVRSVYADGDGDFTLWLTPGATYRLVATRDGYEQAEQEVTL